MNILFFMLVLIIVLLFTYKTFNINFKMLLFLLSILIGFSIYVKYSYSENNYVNIEQENYINVLYLQR